MNNVEARHLENTSRSLNITENGNNTLDDGFENGTHPFENVTLPTEDMMTTIAPNLTIVGTMLRTAITMQNITETESQEQFSHPFYIYIWAIAILGCILLTTGRLVTLYSHYI